MTKSRLSFGLRKRVNMSVLRPRVVEWPWLRPAPEQHQSELPSDLCLLHEQSAERDDLMTDVRLATHLRRTQHGADVYHGAFRAHRQPGADRAGARRKLHAQRLSIEDLQAGDPCQRLCLMTFQTAARDRNTC